MFWQSKADFEICSKQISKRRSHEYAQLHKITHFMPLCKGLTCQMSHTKPKSHWWFYRRFTAGCSWDIFKKTQTVSFYKVPQNWLWDKIQMCYKQERLPRPQQSTVHRDWSTITIPPVLATTFTLLCCSYKHWRYGDTDLKIQTENKQIWEFVPSLVHVHSS